LQKVRSNQYRKLRKNEGKLNTRRVTVGRYISILDLYEAYGHHSSIDINP
jgi:hypothetical protein